MIPSSEKGFSSISHDPKLLGRVNWGEAVWSTCVGGGVMSIFIIQPCSMHN